VTTANFVIDGPYTWSNLVSGTYYYPDANGTILDGFDNLTIRAQLYGAVANGGPQNSVTMTIESDPGLAVWAWDETLGLYDWMTGTRGTASFVAAGATVNCRLQVWNHNARLWRVKIVINDGGGAARNSGIIEIRKIKV
jgi:hypothetical protein